MKDILIEETSLADGLDTVFDEVADRAYPAIYACVDPVSTKVQLRAFNAPNKMQIYIMVCLLCEMYQELPPDLSSITTKGTA